MLDPHALTRRTFTKSALGSLLTWSLLDSVFRRGALDAKVEPLTTKWLTDLNDLGRAVKARKLLQVEWQSKVEELFAKVDVADFCKLIDFAKLKQNVKFADKGERSIGFQFPKVEGLPTEWVFGKQIFALKQGRSVTPHGHNNMATAFLILEGEFQGRHYDRVEDSEEHMVIRPTLERKFVRGECSTISDYQDNVHWFQALSEPAFIFNIHVVNLRPEQKVMPGRVYLDPNGEKLKGGLIRARLISSRESIKLYG